MTEKNGSNALSVFIAESMNPDDVYRGHKEGDAIAQILKLLEVRAYYRTVVDRSNLSKAMSAAKKKGVSVFHISCHAGRDGIKLTSKQVISWEELAGMARDRLRDKILCLSACEAGKRNVPGAFRRQGNTPDYIVGPESAVMYAQACVAWSIFYHCLAQEGITKEHMQHAMDRMNQAVDSDFLYRRWTGKKYMRYPAAKNAGKGKG